MGTILASAIINKAALTLMDVNNIKWARTELLSWLNDGQRAIVSMVPETSTTTANVTMVSGSLQSLPAAAYMLLDVTRNMGAGGSTPGRAIARVDRQTLDESNPTWQADTATSVVTVYMYSLRNRGKFFVYPPQTTSNQVEIIYSATPTDLAEAGALGIQDIFAPALLDYILSRAFNKESQYANPSKAAQYFQSFAMFIATNVQDAAALTAVMGALSMNQPPTVGTATVGNGGQ